MPSAAVTPARPLPITHTRVDSAMPFAMSDPFLIMGGMLQHFDGAAAESHRVAADTAPAPRRFRARQRRRSRYRYVTGVVKSVRSWLRIRPPTMAMPRGRRSSLPMPGCRTLGYSECRRIAVGFVRTTLAFRLLAFRDEFAEIASLNTSTRSVTLISARWQAALVLRSAPGVGQLQVKSLIRGGEDFGADRLPQYIDRDRLGRMVTAFDPRIEAKVAKQAADLRFVRAEQEPVQWRTLSLERLLEQLVKRSVHERHALAGIHGQFAAIAQYSEEFRLRRALSHRGKHLVAASAVGMLNDLNIEQNSSIAVTVCFRWAGDSQFGRKSVGHAVIEKVVGELLRLFVGSVDQNVLFRMGPPGEQRIALAKRR